MRVYEFAKEKESTSKEILSLLKKEGYSISSHMSVLSDDILIFLNKCFVKKPIDKKSSTAEKIKQLQQKVAKTKEAKSSVTKKQISRVTAKKSISKFSGPQQSETLKIGQEKKVKFKQKKENLVDAASENITEISIDKEMRLFEVADLLGKKSGELILILLKKGIMCNLNHFLSVENISMLAEHFDITVVSPLVVTEIIEKKPIDFSNSDNVVTRWPVVVVMGHVDHGKTTFLDYVRKMNTAAKEKGGITQHLGAYEVESSHGKIVFLDTPGHEAFTYIRRRGVRITDMAVLMIAVDDGVKPQTIEAIRHAKEADVPIVVAINKIDKISSPSAIETVKRQLAEHDLLSEDWGGDLICIPISAKTGQGVEELLEMIVLQSHMLELKADPTSTALAFVLESKLEKGYGPVASVICSNGTIRLGDYFVCGDATGKVRLLVDSFGRKIREAGPSIPVQVIGFNKFASLGDWLEVVPQNIYAKARSGGGFGSVFVSAVPKLYEGGKTINLILKTDTNGSKQAVLDVLDNLKKQYKDLPANISVIQSGIGDITEKDVDFASNTNSLIIGLHVKVERNAIRLAKEKKVSIGLYQIIYKLSGFIEDLFEKSRIIEKVLTKVGEARVLTVFNIKGVGVIAGCIVSEGVFSKGCKVECFRKDEKVGEGVINSLQRERKTVKEVHAGYECGFISKEFDGWQEGDIVHAFQETEKK